MHISIPPLGTIRNPRNCGFFFGFSHLRHFDRRKKIRTSPLYYAILRYDYAKIPPLLRQEGKMAYVRKRGKVFRVEVCKVGPDGITVRDGETLPTRTEAYAWGARREAEILSGAAAIDKKRTFGDLLRRYVDEVSSTKQGERWERIRIGALVDGRPQDMPAIAPDPLAAVKLVDLDERHIAAWRDRRLRKVSPASVRREWTLLSAACTVALREWQWLDKHPMRQVRRPKDSEPRARRPTDDEIEQLLYCLGYDREQSPVTLTARVGAAVLFAIETAMRAGEIAALRWQDVEMDRRYLRTQGKTPAAKREVPLSTEALRILAQMAEGRDGDSVFQMRGASLDALFRKAKRKAVIEDLHFHDLRHEAITRLAKVLDVLPLAKAIGIKDLRMLMVYYNPTAEELAKKLR